jgi:hypothetical protein
LEKAKLRMTGPLARPAKLGTPPVGGSGGEKPQSGTPFVWFFSATFLWLLNLLRNFFIATAKPSSPRSRANRRFANSRNIVRNLECPDFAQP